MSDMQALDDLLLEISTLIELSDRDRAVAERRYSLLKKHLERESSALNGHLAASDPLIYAQGSLSIGSTIVSGTDDDRFDVDALVDFEVPGHLGVTEPLALLEKSLRGFPDALRIVRCTRCVQLQFPFMHMDVTILDRMKGSRPERVGEIYHNPEHGPAYRVPSNPFGFSQWYRKAVDVVPPDFARRLRESRNVFAYDRLAVDEALAQIDQEELPHIIPPRLDAQQVVALKLLKRFVNLFYCDRDVKRPPSIYLTKKSADCGFAPEGLTAQLIKLASCIEEQMNQALVLEKGPDERNPQYDADRINDRWPKNQLDRRTLCDAMKHLQNELHRASGSQVGQIKRILSELFGERVSSAVYEKLASRPTRSFEQGTGRIFAAPLVSAPQRRQQIPAHNFHSEEQHRVEPQGQK